MHYENIRNEIVKLHKNVHALKSYEILKLYKNLMLLKLHIVGENCEYF